MYDFIYILYFGAIVLSLLYGFMVTYLRYTRLNKVIPSLIKEHNIDPSKTYLITGNKATYLRLITFNDQGIRQVIITNYWIRELSLIDKDVTLKYEDIDYAIYVPYIHVSFVLKNDIKSLVSNVFSSLMTIDLPFTYSVDKHSLFNISFFKGAIYRSIMKELEIHGVKASLSVKPSQDRRNSLILLVATILISGIAISYYMIST